MEHYFTSNENLKSEFRTINYNCNGIDFSFLSDNGVFSKDEIDYGSNFLVKVILKNEKERNKILDVGCGYGFIGIVLSKSLNSEVDMIDVNKRAIHLTEKNIENNRINGHVFLSDSYENVENKYDMIVTNPPIRAGKSKVLDILINAKDHLNDNGKLYYVIRKDQGCKSISKMLEKYYHVELLEKDKGFYVYLARKIQ